MHIASHLCVLHGGGESCIHAGVHLRPQVFLCWPAGTSLYDFHAKAIDCIKQLSWVFWYL